MILSASIPARCLAAAPPYPEAGNRGIYQYSANLFSIGFAQRDDPGGGGHATALDNAFINRRVRFDIRFHRRFVGDRRRLWLEPAGQRKLETRTLLVHWPRLKLLCPGVTRGRRQTL